MLHAAASAGADAVYLGMGSFNARRNADNFDYATFEAACDYAHLRGINIYVAMNTIILPHELDEAVSCAKQCHRLGADAFIVQDVGLLSALQRAIPGVRIHASTQMSIHNADGILACAQLGCSRVTLARELSLPEISHLCDVATQVGVEVETFAHGALCVCYSGQCLMSSLIGGRSANRGLCAQACRLPYELKDMRDPGKALKSPGPHLLSPKDLCTIDAVGELAAAGVASLKIEGRMKSSEYVYTTVEVYREALEKLRGALASESDKSGGLAASQAPDSRERQGGAKAKKRLESVFSRGFTEAYLTGERGNDIMSYQRPNNRGQFIGRVRQVRGKDVLVNTEFDLIEGDVIEVWTSRSNIALPVGADAERRGKAMAVPLGDAFAKKHKGQGARDASRDIGHIHEGDRVFRVRSAEASYQDDDREPRVPIEGTATLRLGDPLKISFSLADDGSPVARRLASQAGSRDIKAWAEGLPIEAARTKAVSADEVVEHVDRLGQTPFALTRFDVEIDAGVGIGFSQIHRVRTEALGRLEDEILARRQEGLSPNSAKAADVEPRGAAPHQTEHKTSFAEEAAADSEPFKANPDAVSRPPTHQRSEHAVCVLATNPECARAAKRAGADIIYVPALNYRRGQATYVGCIASEPSQAGFPKHCTIVMPTVVHDHDHDHKNESASTNASASTGPLAADDGVWQYAQPACPLMVDSLAALYRATDAGSLPEVGPGLPITNESAVRLVDALGASRIWLSPELNLAQIAELAGGSPNMRFGLKVAGAQELMVTEHCMLMSQGPCSQQCETCTRRKVPHALRDRKGYDFPVATDSQGRSHIYNSVELDNVASLPALIDAGIADFMLDATLMTPEQTAQATGRLVQALGLALDASEAVPKKSGTTTGHLHRGVA